MQSAPRHQAHHLAARVRRPRPVAAINRPVSHGLDHPPAATRVPQAAAPRVRDRPLIVDVEHDPRCVRQTIHHAGDPDAAAGTTRLACLNASSNLSPDDSPPKNGGSRLSRMSFRKVSRRFPGSSSPSPQATRCQLHSRQIRSPRHLWVNRQARLPQRNHIAGC